MSLTLVIGNKNYSSWSLRPWLAMKQAGVAFNETSVVLNRPDSTEKILRYSPSGRVPCLIDGELTVFDSLAICEYVNERLIEDGKRQPVAARCQGARARALGDGRDAFGLRRAAHAYADGYPIAACRQRSGCA